MNLLLFFTHNCKDKATYNMKQGKLVFITLYIQVSTDVTILSSLELYSKMKYENKKNFISNRFGSTRATARAGCSKQFHFKPALTL